MGQSKNFINSDFFPILFNDDVITVLQGDTLLKVLSTRSIDIHSVAVAINGEVVPFSNWDTTVMKRDDEVLVIVPAQGG